MDIHAEAESVCSCVFSIVFEWDDMGSFQYLGKANVCNGAVRFISENKTAKSSLIGAHAMCFDPLAFHVVRKFTGH